MQHGIPRNRGRNVGLQSRCNFEKQRPKGADPITAGPGPEALDGKHLRHRRHLFDSRLLCVARVVRAAASTATTIAAAIPSATPIRPEIVRRPFVFFRSAMSSPIILLAAIAGWFVLNRFVLPRFGVAT